MTKDNQTTPPPPRFVPPVLFIAPWLFEVQFSITPHCQQMSDCESLCSYVISEENVAFLVCFHIRIIVLDVK